MERTMMNKARNMRHGRPWTFVLIAISLLTSLPPVRDLWAAEDTRLNTLARVEDLQATFNRDKGKIRIVLLLSPT